MKALRGATTVANDCAEEIRGAVKELLNEIKKVNNLNNGQIICIMFSNTQDLRSFYPAKAAREAGFADVALYSSLEPDIDGALEKCIRVMLLVDTDAPAKHVYLRGAKNLRKDLASVINIALDGPAGSGKSTISKLIAKKMNILCLDTGAMYRACALKCLREGVSVTDESAVAKLIENIDLKVEYCGGVQKTLLDGGDVSEEIRKNEISMLASTVSALGCVRTKMVDLQRKIAKNTSCILDGRDIGANVLPDARFKFFLTASPEVRAKRRFDELKNKGFEVDFEELKSEIIKRDEQDKNRENAPLKIADDAVLVDSSDMTIEEVAAFIEEKIQEKI